MVISRLRNWIEGHRPGWLAAILLASMLAAGACVATPAMAKTATAAGPGTDCPMLQHNQPGACCVNAGAATHATAIPVSDATPHLAAPPAGHAATATFAVPIDQANRSLRPPIRAPAAPARPIYLLNCALLN